MGEVLAIFKQHYRPNDPQSKKNVEATVEKFVNGGKAKGGIKVRGVGARKKLADVTAHDVDSWLDDYPNTTRVSTIHRKAHLSIFFRTCQRVYDMTFTPFTSGKLKARGDLLTIYKKRTKAAIKRVADLRMLFDALDDDFYWQSWVAFACLAGPRWHEQRAILVSDLDLLAQPPRVIIQATTETDVKTIGNAVPIEKKLLLPILRRFAATWEPGRALAWPSLRKNRDRTGRRQPKGFWSHTNFSKWMKAALKKAQACSRDPNHELWKYGPAEWRHTFGTLLALSGKNATEIAKWMRDSAEVVVASYVTFYPTDERVKRKLQWE